jgi:hypothetical protein
MEQEELQDTIMPLPKPIKWVVSDTIRTEHATHLIVQQQGSEFTFFFFEEAVPPLLGPQEEQIAAYEALEYIEAKCVAKVVMSAENATLAENILMDSLNIYQATLQQAMNGPNDIEKFDTSKTQAQLKWKLLH